VIAPFAHNTVFPTPLMFYT